MTTRILLPFAAALALLAGLLAPTTAHASSPTVVVEAARTFGLESYTLVPLTKGGDITRPLTDAAKLAGSAQAPILVHLPSGKHTVTDQIKVASHVYLVADPNTTVTWKGGKGQLLRFLSAGPSGVYGGIWDGGRRKDSVVIVAKGATVTLAKLTVRKAAKHGIAGYGKAKLTLRDVTATSNENGVSLQDSTLDAIRLRATLNRRNGLQLEQRSVGTVIDSSLDRNGQAVKGTTTGKTGHGLAVAASRATVTNTSMSDNKVCGVSLSKAGQVVIANGTLARNGRHGIGTTAGTGAAVTDSSIVKNRYNGVLSSGAGTLVSLTRVTISDSKKYGVSLPGGSATLVETTVQKSGIINLALSKKARLTLGAGNAVLSAKSHGIAIEGKGKLVLSGEGNEIRSNKGNGLMLSGSGTTGTISSPVAFTKNRKNGILVKSKAKLTMVAASFSGNKGKKVLKQSGGKVTTKKAV